MAEKKATTKAAATKTTAAKTTKKATATKKCATKVILVDADNAGFRAGDVYQALAAAEKALTVAEIAKNAKISKEEAYLGIGWLFKEGKVNGEEGLITLA